MLNVPIKHVGGAEGRQKYRDVLVDDSTPWQRLHWRTLETSYRTSPFFEFYEDELKHLFENKETSLFEFNLKTIKIVGECLGVEIPLETTGSFSIIAEDYQDARFLVEAKKHLEAPMPAYAQVFEERHGFISNLSILDLLFNEGTYALTYLKTLPLKFLDD